MTDYYYTLDARYKGLHQITIHSDGRPVYVCGHSVMPEELEREQYCGKGDLVHEWVTICCRDDDNDGNGTAHK